MLLTISFIRTKDKYHTRKRLERDTISKSLKDLFIVAGNLDANGI